MEHVSIEALLLDEQGLVQIGQLMATDNMHDDIMQQLSLLDVTPDILDKIDIAYKNKLEDMKIRDTDAAKLSADADPTTLNLVNSNCSELGNETHVEPGFSL